MASDIRPNLGIESNWSATDDGWADGANKNWNIIDALIFARPIFSVGTPPVSPDMGDIYVIPASGCTGDWIGNEAKVAIYGVSDWIYLDPKEGWRVLKDSTDPREWYIFDGSAWVLDSVTVDMDIGDIGDVDLTGLSNGKFLQWNSTAGKWKPVAVTMADAPTDGLPYVRKDNAWILRNSLFRHFKAGIPTGSEVCAVFIPEEETEFPIDFAGSYATVETPGTTASTVFKIQKNTTDIGTLTFAVGATKGVFVAASATTFDPTLTTPDRLRIVGPASANAALAGLTVSLKGTPVA